MREELDGLRLAIDGYLLTLPSLNGLLNHPLELEQIELGEHGDMVKPEGHRKLNSLPNHGRHVGSNSSLTSFVITALSSSHINGLNPEATRPSYVWVSNFDGLNTPRFGLPTEASLAFECKMCAASSPSVGTRHRFGLPWGDEATRHRLIFQWENEASFSREAMRCCSPTRR
ncbi:hypothetical protein BHM03_00038115 [Ensete ventricosum]|nr:hypothetical protein BHM03_00038115 [Ensete ventricosum]